MITMTIISVLNSTMVSKFAKLKKPQFKKNFYPLLCIHQDGGTGVFLKTRKKRQKNYGGNTWLF